MGLGLDAFRPSGAYGYTCKAWLARKIEEEFPGSRCFVWFARRLNPLQNPLSANPIEIYRLVDQAVQRGDDAEPKIKDLRANIHLGIQLRLGDTNRARAEQLHRIVTAAPIEMFHPQIWRLKLSRIDATRWSPGEHDGRDEMRIEDLTLGEFDEIVE